MPDVRITCHADLQALQNRSDKILGVELRSLESLRIASESYALLRYLIQQKSTQVPLVDISDFRYWTCPQIDLLSLVAGVALELRKMKHDLSPLLVVQKAKLDEGFLEALLLLKNSAVVLEHLAKDAKETIENFIGSDEEDEDEEDEDEDDDVPLGKLLSLHKLLGKVEKVGKNVKDTADLVLKGTKNIAWLQLRLPPVLDVVDVLLSIRVLFPDD